jgi:diketogulonate reductase-like aldo/keto reductase
MTAIQFLTQTGHMSDDWRQEFILLTDVLGVSMLVDAINNCKPRGASESTALGPFYVADAPLLPMGANICLDRKGIRHIGLSEVDADTIRRAAAAHPIVDLQIEYSLLERRLEGEVLSACRQLGIAITAYGVLARGLLGGHLKALPPANDYRRFSPRFRGKNFRANRELAERLRTAAVTWRATPAQAAIAWVLARGDDMIPLVGARSRARLDEAIAALDLEPSAAELRHLETAAPPRAAAGLAFPPEQKRVGNAEEST